MKREITERKTFGYARVSTKEQEREGYSLEAQEREIKNYVQREGLEPVEIYSEAGSASFARGYKPRPKFTAMLNKVEKRAKKKEGSVLIACDLSRLGRNSKDFSLTKDLLRDGYLEVRIIEDNILLDKDSSAMAWKLINQIAVEDEFYSDHLSEKVRFGLKEKAEQGFYPTQAPLGYVNYREESGRAKIKPDPEKAPLIVKAFRLYTTGRYSLRTLASKLHGMGLGYKRSNAKVSGSVMRNILSNPIYVGDFRFNERLYKGQHEPLISRELFNEVQRVLKYRGEKHIRGSKYTFPFGHGLIWCGHCGKSITAEEKRHRRGYTYHYYHCPTKNCPGKEAVQEEELEKAFETIFEKFLLLDEYLEWVLDAVGFVKEEQTSSTKNDLKAKQNERKRLQSKEDKLLDLLIDGILTQEEYRAKKMANEESLGKLDELVEKLGAEVDTQDIKPEFLAKTWKRGISLFKQANVDGKRMMLDALLGKANIQTSEFGGIRELVLTVKVPFGFLAGKVSLGGGENGACPDWREVVKLEQPKRKKRVPRSDHGSAGVSLCPGEFQGTGPGGLQH